MIDPIHGRHAETSRFNVGDRSVSGVAANTARVTSDARRSTCHVRSNQSMKGYRRPASGSSSWLSPSQTLGQTPPVHNSGFGASIAGCTAGMYLQSARGDSPAGNFTGMPPVRNRPLIDWLDMYRTVVLLLAVLPLAAQHEKKDDKPKHRFIGDPSRYRGRTSAVYRRMRRLSRRRRPGRPRAEFAGTHLLASADEETLYNVDPERHPGRRHAGRLSAVRIRSGRWSHSCAR